MAEGRPFHVECHGDVLGLLLPQEFHKHVREAVDGVCGEALGIRQFGNGVKGTVDVIVAIDQDQDRSGIGFGGHS